MEGREDPIQIEELGSLIRIARISATPVAIGPSSEGLLEEIEQFRRNLLLRYSGRAPSAIEELAPARDLYRRLGMDPTRTRPSSEALLRRVLLGKPLPRISNAVDLCNLLSLRFLLPLGLYDSEEIQGSVILRKGSGHESFPGIRKERVNLEGRPVLADSHGPFGNPTSDSLRTSVTPATRSLWLVIFAPAWSTRAELEGRTSSACDAISRHLAPPDEAVETRAQVFP